MIFDFHIVHYSFNHLFSSELKGVGAHILEWCSSLFAGVEDVSEQSIPVVVALSQLPVNFLACPHSRHLVVEYLHLDSHFLLQQFKEVELLAKSHINIAFIPLEASVEGTVMAPPQSEQASNYGWDANLPALRESVSQVGVEDASVVEPCEGGERESPIRPSIQSILQEERLDFLGCEDPLFEGVEDGEGFLLFSVKMPDSNLVWRSLFSHNKRLYILIIML